MSGHIDYIRILLILFFEDFRKGGLNGKDIYIYFIVGTYDTPGVSHVGIYVGDGVMIHCGDPIQYTSINSSYWQQHFYAFGRPAY